MEPEVASHDARNVHQLEIRASPTAIATTPYLFSLLSSAAMATERGAAAHTMAERASA
jgi:hypothetical protein